MANIKPMEIHLRYDKTDLQLPQLPPSFEVQGQGGNQSVTVNAIGEVTLIGKPQLQTIEIQSVFPVAAKKGVTIAKPKAPYSYVKTLKAWKDKGCIITVIITQTDISMQATIESFSYGENSEGAPGDVTYTLSLKQYKPHPVPKTSSSSTGKSKTTARTSTPKIKPGTTYKTKKGDTLAKIAKAAYGKTKYKKKLYKKNKKAIEKAWKKYAKKQNKAIKKWNKKHPNNKKKLLPKTSGKGKRIAPGTKIVIPKIKKSTAKKKTTKKKKKK